MNYKQMILVEHLTYSFLTNATGTSYKLVFNLDGDLHTGSFLKYDEHGREYLTGEMLDNTYGNKTNIFSINNIDKKQEIRTAFFEHVFGPKEYREDSQYKSFLSNTDLVFREIVDFAKKYEPKFLNPEFKLPNCIYDLKNINSGKVLEFYLLSSREEMIPVSLMKITEE